MNTLPEDIQGIIAMYAHPVMAPELKRSLQVTSSHMTIKHIEKTWIGTYPTIQKSWSEYLEMKIPFERRKEVLRGLANCGCCNRHSNGVFDFPHCTHIVGSHTWKKYERKRTWIRKPCNCWCRTQMRYLLGFDSKLESVIQPPVDL